jgi:hypothetical protein
LIASSTSAIANEDEVRVDGISGAYRLSEHTICVEMYANKIVDGKGRR